MVTQRTLTPLCEGSIPSASVAHGRRRKAPYEAMRCLWAAQNKSGNMCQNSAWCECVDMRVIEENNLKAREF